MWKEDSVRRTTRWVNKNLTLGKISDIIKQVSVFSPIILTFLILYTFISIIQITDQNLNFAFSLYKPLREEFFSHILFYSLIGVTAFSYLLASYPTIANICNILLNRIARKPCLVKTARKNKIFKTTALITLLALLAIIFIFLIVGYKTNFICSFMLAPLISVPITLVISRIFGNYDNILHFPKKLFLLISAILIIFQTGMNFSESDEMHAQSCAYKIENDRIYAYRYFETNNWADKIEIALLPDSSDKWIDDSKLQIPTKITVDKSELRSLKSCTDKYSTWSEAERLIHKGRPAAKNTNPLTTENTRP